MLSVLLLWLVFLLLLLLFVVVVVVTAAAVFGCCCCCCLLFLFLFLFLLLLLLFNVASHLQLSDPVLNAIGAVSKEALVLFSKQGELTADELLRAVAALFDMNQVRPARSSLFLFSSLLSLSLCLSGLAVCLFAVVLVSQARADANVIRGCWSVSV